MSSSAKTFRHGVHPPECKATADAVVTRIPWPDEVVVLLSQHTGAPAKALVAKKQPVMRGEVIAEAGGFVSVPMHAPITGTVSAVDLALNPRGELAPAILIKRDPEADQETVYGTPRDLGNLSGDALIKAIQDTGLVGLGGAAFPTHVKLKVPEGKKIAVVVVNGCECEPYLTTDYRLMVEQADKVIAGLRIVLQATGAPKAVIAIENNKPEALDAMMRAVTPGDPISVTSLATKYPQGAEKMLCDVILHRQIPSGGLPSDAGMACFNVATLAQMGELLPRGQGLIERIITVTGGGVERPGNYLAPLGTPLRHIMEHACIRPDARKIINGGPMMGISVASLDVPLTKGASGLLVLRDDEIQTSRLEEYPCIHCARCMDACPMFLNPSHLGQLARKKRYEEMAEEHHLNDCFECGCCSYVCPSNIPLVQYFRIAKAMLRERSAAR
ncbi:MAG: Electron transport complex protein RnfC [Candidatus Hydrogenedentes bacterium ADurb.Bin101]|nr:MAG: Electron transport complex protein RnfC [Candidatus Hydrogenedentes bacterium ADurb.Bin101]HOC68086.1 electron transport complex subunit RsxC [Candidatus Hydrogenedentota bacterium]